MLYQGCDTLELVEKNCIIDTRTANYLEIEYNKIKHARTR